MQIRTKTRTLKLVVFSFFFIHKVIAQPELAKADSFRVQFLNTFEYCEHMEVVDTIQFLKQGLYSMINYDYTASFNQLFFCFEKGYMNLVEPDRRRYPTEELYRVRDIRWLFLFYLDRYILGKRDTFTANKFCKVSLWKLEKKKKVEVVMWDEGSSEELIMIYQQLIKLVNRKHFSLTKLKQKNKTLFEVVGYEFSTQPVSALW